MRLGASLEGVASRLETSGAGVLLIACNTLHFVAGTVRERIGIPLLHIAEAAAGEARERGWKRVGLLGSAFVMEQEFYNQPFRECGIEVSIPAEADRRELNRIIFEELSRAELRDESRLAVLRMIDDLRSGGAEAAVLACTELPLLVRPGDTGVPLLDTLTVHTEAAVNFALSNRTSCGDHSPNPPSPGTNYSAVQY